MSFRLPSSTALHHETSVSFNDDDEDDHRTPTPQLDRALVGPEWNHQKSFYSQQTDVRPPSSHRQSFTPKLAQPVARMSESRPMKTEYRNNDSEVRLSDTIDVYVDDKFFNTHNLHYGPAIIRIEDNRPVGNYSNSSPSSWSNNSSSYDSPPPVSSSPYNSPSRFSHGSDYSSAGSSGSSIITI